MDYFIGIYIGGYTYPQLLTMNRVFPWPIQVEAMGKSWEKIKGPDNPTSQLLPIISMKGCSRDGERRLGKGGGEGSRS